MLLNMASKVFRRVILGRIETALDKKLRKEWAGFELMGKEEQGARWV